MLWFYGLLLGQKQETELQVCWWQDIIQGLSLEERGAEKSLLALGQHVHPMLAAEEMLGGQGSCRTDSLQTGIRKVSPAHGAKVPLWVGLSDCLESYAPTGAGVLNTACTNIGICQCYPLDPACPKCPSLQAWPQGWGCWGSPVIKFHFVLANALMPHARLPGGRGILELRQCGCWWWTWCYCLALPLTLPSPKAPRCWHPLVLHCLCTSAAKQKSGCNLFLQTHGDKQVEKNGNFIRLAQPCVTTSTKGVMDVEAICLQTKNCHEIFLLWGNMETEDMSGQKKSASCGSNELI